MTEFELRWKEEDEGEELELDEADDILDPEQLSDSGGLADDFFGLVTQLRREEGKYGPQIRLLLLPLTQPANIETQIGDPIQVLEDGPGDDEFQGYNGTGCIRVWVPANRASRWSKEGELKVRIKNYDPSKPTNQGRRAMYLGLASYWKLIDIFRDDGGDEPDADDPRYTNWWKKNHVASDVLLPAGSIRRWNGWKDFRKKAGLDDVPAPAAEEGFTPDERKVGKSSKKAASKGDGPSIISDFVATSLLDGSYDLADVNSKAGEVGLGGKKNATKLKKAVLAGVPLAFTRANDDTDLDSDRVAEIVGPLDWDLDNDSDMEKVTTALEEAGIEVDFE